MKSCGKSIVNGGEFLFRQELHTVALHKQTGTKEAFNPVLASCFIFQKHEYLMVFIIRKEAINYN